jgi:hypothetical protein
VLRGVFMMLRDRVHQPGTLPAFSGECDETLDPLCAALLDRPSARRGGSQALGGGFAAPTVQAEEACVRAGYLCSGLDQLGYIDIRRWKSQEGTIVVHVPLPASESAGDTRRLQNVAAAGI